MLYSMVICPPLQQNAHRTERTAMDSELSDSSGGNRSSLSTVQGRARAGCPRCFVGTTVDKPSATRDGRPSDAP